MINREMQTVTIKSFASTLNDYGEKTLSETTTSAQMMVKQYSQGNVQDPRYVDVEYIGLTKAAVTTENVVTIDSVDYMVLYVIPSGRYTQVMMKVR